MQNNKNDKSNWLLVAAVIVLGISIWYWLDYSGRTKAGAERTLPSLEVSAMPIEGKDIAIVNQYIGFVTPINDVEVMSYISGYIEEVVVSGGEEVKAGDILVMIKQDEYKANMDLADAQLLKAQANFENASSYYYRIKKAGKKAISQSEIDNAKAQFLSAKAAREEAKANYDLAKVNFDYTVIRAPISGIVGNVSLTKGDYVSPQAKVLFSIVQYNPIRVVFSISDKEYLEYGADFANNIIKLRLENGEIFSSIGKFGYIDNSLNRQTNSLAVYVDFANPDKQLLANAYVDVLSEKILKNVVAVRQNLVNLSPEGNYIYIASLGQIIKKKIDIIAQNDGDYLLQNNFSQGDMLVLGPVEKISPEQKIVIKSVSGKGE